MPAADGTGASCGGSMLDPNRDIAGQGIELVPTRDVDGSVGSSRPQGLVGSSQVQQPPEIILVVRDEQNRHASELEMQEEQAERHLLENQQQGHAGAPGGSSEPDPEAEQQVEPIIPKVRKQLRLVTDDLFTPQIMLIGPYHDWEDYNSFPWMEEKKKVVNHLKGLLGDSRFEDLKTMLAEMWPHEVRRFYTHLPDKRYTQPAEFTSMLLHDGCYLLSLFFLFREQRGAPGSDRQIIGPIDNTLVRDTMYLLENQIPLFVLQRILDLVMRPREAMCIRDRIASFVKTLLQMQLYISNTVWPVPSEPTPSDLLHLVYSYFRHPRQEERPLAAQRRCCLTCSWRWVRDLLLVCSYTRHRGHEDPTVEALEEQRVLTGKWRQATDYSKYANLQFKPRVFSEGDGAWTILDINLQGGTLYIPFLRVDCNTWTMLRNLIALELEEQLEMRPVTAYCYFMSQVACTAEDVGLLQRAKVLEHFLGSDEQAAKGFVELCSGVVLDINNPNRNYLKPIWHQLDKRCRKWVHNFKGFFRQKYWTSVFYRFAFFIALLVFLSEMIQGIYAPIAYHKPHN